MATWKKIIVSGSQAELAGLSVDATIQGSINGNAATATNVAASGVTGLDDAIAGNSAVSANSAKTGFTDALARGAISVSGDLSYDSATGVISYTDSANYTDSDARGAISVSGDLAYNASTGVISFTERTDSEVRGLLSVSGDLSYNATTGQISFTERTDSEVRGLISAGGDLAYNSTTGVISFTERTDSEVKALLSAGGDLSYNATTGQFSFTERTDSEVKALLSAGGDLSYDAASGQFSFTERTDSEVRGLISTQGDLIYDAATGVIAYSAPTMYADSDARSAISVSDAGGDGSLAYDSATGVITYTGPSENEVRAHFSAGTGVELVEGAISIGQAVGTSDNVTFNNLTLAGDLTVNGTTTTISTNNIEVEDRFAFFNAGGGALSSEGGIIVEGANAGRGEALFYDGLSSRRWSLASNVAKDASNVLPSAAVAAVFQGGEQEMVDAGHALVGNIRIEGGEAFIVVAE